VSSSSRATRPELLADMAATMRTFMAHAVLFQEAVAKAVGINATDLQCANLLLLHGPCTPGELAERAGITAGGAVTTVIDRLERAGLARRERSGTDRRKVLVIADEAALWRRVGPSYQRIGQRWDDHLETFTDEQLEFAVALLARAAELNAEGTAHLRGPGAEVDDQVK
jgi:DNA-binding MarR family transcriptional regulator